MRKDPKANKEYLKKWRDENKTYFQEYRETHREQLCKAVKKWQKAHKEQRAAYWRRWAEKNRERRNAQQRERYARKKQEGLELLAPFLQKRQAMTGE